MVRRRAERERQRKPGRRAELSWPTAWDSRERDAWTGPADTQAQDGPGGRAGVGLSCVALRCVACVFQFGMGRELCKEAS